MASSLPLLLALAAIDPVASQPANPRDVLWNIVHEQCVDNYQNHARYAPCSLVDLAGRFVVFKQSAGPYQYLLLPSDLVTGIEDPKLLAATAPNYLYQAWSARGFLAEILQRRVRETDMLLAINPRNARTQDQLHIHISCMKLAVKAQLHTLAGVGAAWRPAFGEYWARSLSVAQLQGSNPFQLVRELAVAQRSDMGVATVALLSLEPGSVIVLAALGSAEQPIAAEALQDHSCSVVDG